MTKQHPGTGVSHNFPGLGFSSRLVAVNGTVGAGRFLVPIRTFSKAQLRIIQKFTARLTQTVPIIVMVGGAINANHLAHGQAFTGQAFFD